MQHLKHEMDWFETTCYVSKNQIGLFIISFYSFQFGQLKSFELKFVFLFASDFRGKGEAIHCRCMIFISSIRCLRTAQTFKDFPNVFL